MPTLSERLGAITLVVFDCDGVMTDGSILMLGDGQPALAFHARDGLGIKMLHWAGVATAVITGRPNTAAAKRAAMLGMGEVLEDRLDKGPALDELLRRRPVPTTQVAYMGDDLADLAAFSRVAVSLCPVDAAPEVRAAADYVTQAGGGHGAVREVAELILKAQGRWDEVLAHLSDIHRGSAP